MKILLIEDDKNQRKLLRSFLKKNKYDVLTAEDGKIGMEKFKEFSPEVVLTDFKMPKMNGLEVLKDIKKINPLTIVIVITAYSDVNDAVSVIKAGAVDYILKPLDLDELITKIDKAFRQFNVRKESFEMRNKKEKRLVNKKLIGESNTIKRVLSIISRISQSNAGVLITGESGTGKEVVAELIHENSDRKFNNLVKVNCSALPDTLLESELFGHKKGAFTGANRDRKGRFEEADGGTLFLDEIGDISPAVQVKLLRVLQNMTFEPLGSSISKKVDVRIIAATNKELEDEITKNNFREDLYYRINVVPIHLPPLRKRKEDIPLLIDHFLKESGKSHMQFSSEAMNKIVSYDWKGNIRELKNILTRITTLSFNNRIDINDLPAEMRNSINSKNDDTLESIEKNHIAKVLNSVNGNRKEAAKILGIHRNTLTRKLKKYNID